MKRSLPPPIKNLRKYLTSIHRTLHAYRNDAEYFFHYDGGQQHAARWEKNRWRKKGKIMRALNAARKTAQVISDPALVEAVETVRFLAREVVYCCRWFPNNDYAPRTWAGLLPLQQFDSAIRMARQIALGTAGVAV